jgi:hypothetical protein
LSNTSTVTAVFSASEESLALQYSTSMHVCELIPTIGLNFDMAAALGLVQLVCYSRQSDVAEAVGDDRHVRLVRTQL